ncbi:MAG: hypothetical protein ACRBBP_03685 [Bdellovibrionales bacterium]
MDTPETPVKTFSQGLWIPAVIICLGFLFSMAFVLKTLKGYKQPQPLLIKPSSVQTPEEITESLYKALYPLKQRSYGVELGKLENDDVSSKVASSLSEKFPKSTYSFRLNTYKVLLTDKHDTNKTDCKNTALFNLKRKPERKWKKKIYFTVCTEGTEHFSLFYLLK